MANAGSRVSIEGETMRYAEYNSQSKIRSETEIDKRLGGTLIAVGLGVAAAGFAAHSANPDVLVVSVSWLRNATKNSETSISTTTFSAKIELPNGVELACRVLSCYPGRYAFQLWKPLGQVLSQTAKKMPTSAFSSHYYKGGFDQKMTKREASLILGISPTSTKSKVRDAHRRIMVLNHPDKGGSPYMAAKINEAKDLLDKDQRR